MTREQEQLRAALAAGANMGAGARIIAALIAEQPKPTTPNGG